MGDAGTPRLDKALLRDVLLKEREKALAAAESKVAQAHQTSVGWPPQNRAALIELETSVLEKTKRTLSTLENLALGPSGGRWAAARGDGAGPEEPARW